MTKCWTNPSCDTWWPNLQLMQVTESISGSVVPLAMFAKCLRFLVTNYVLQRTVPGHHIQNWRQIYMLTVKAKRRYFYCILPDRWKEVSAICYFESGLVTQFVRVEEWETNLKTQKSPKTEKIASFSFFSRRSVLQILLLQWSNQWKCKISALTGVCALVFFAQNINRGELGKTGQPGVCTRWTRWIY